MRNYFPPETSANYNHSKKLDELIRTKRYKDTPFVIFKDAIGKRWSALLLCEDGKHFYDMWGGRTKAETIKNIDIKKNLESLREDYKELGKLIELLEKYEREGYTGEQEEGNGGK